MIRIAPRAAVLAFVVLALPWPLVAQVPAPAPTTIPAPAASPAPAAPIAPAAPVPKGTITNHVFSDSKIYPGTTRRYTVYVPQEYDASKPACVYIGQDGYNPKIGATFDQLIATHQMPVTVGIFIAPGIIPNPAPVPPGTNPKAAPSPIRINRSYEYNSLGDDYARFLLDEFLPAVVAETKLNLSTSGNDRCIGGGSSGASAAFTAAWEHPEAFSRVFSVSGAFPFARGTCYSDVVRKTEAKPIRVYLHVGKNDMYNANGDLFLDNEKLSRALTFSGYDVQYVVSEGKHMDKYMDVFPDAMIWLWRDWPAPIAEGTSSPEVQAILLPGEPWKLVGQGYGSVGGITVDPKGQVYFSDTGANKIFRVGTDGQVSPFITDARQVGGLTVGADGTIYGVSAGSGDVVAFDAQGAARVVTGSLPGHGIVATRTGGLYVSVPGPPGANESKIWYIDPQGGKKVVDTGLDFAAGMAISADNWLLNVSDSRTHVVYSYQMNPDGTLSDREPYSWLQMPDSADDSGADGIAMCAQGIPFVATRLGIQTTNAQGASQCILPVPSGRVTGVIFGGPAFDILYAACGDKVYARKVRFSGLNAFQPPDRPVGVKL